MSLELLIPVVARIIAVATMNGLTSWKDGTGMREKEVRGEEVGEDERRGMRREEVRGEERRGMRREEVGGGERRGVGDESREHDAAWGV